METLARTLLALLVLVAPLPLARWLGTRLDAEEHSLLGLGWLGTVVAWCALQIGLGIGLALVHLLNLPALLAAEAILAVVGFRCASGFGRPRVRLATTDAVLVLLVTVAGLSALWAVLSVPTRNFDSLAYHLPAMVRWVQTGHLAVAEELGNAARYPYSWEMLGAIAVLPMGRDLLVAVPNLVGWLLLGLAVLVFAQQLGARREHATVAALMWLTVPSVLSRLEAIQPDIALAGFFLAALAFLDRARFARQGWPLLFALVALGLLVGAKTSGLAYAGLAVVLVGGPAWLARRREAPLRWEGIPPWGYGLAVGLLVLVGGVWYLRNLLFTGNPLGFYRVEVLGRELLAGAVGRTELHPTTLASIFDVGNGAHWRLLLSTARQWLGLPAGIFLLATPLVALDLRRNPHDICRRLLVGTLSALVASAVLYWNTPFSGDNGEHGLQLTPWIHVGLRYGYPALAVLAVLGAAGLTAARAPTSIVVVLATMAALIGVVWGLTPDPWGLRGAVSLSTLAALALHRDWVSPRVLGFGLGVVLLAAVIPAASLRSEGRARWYGGVDGYLASIDSGGTVVGYTGTVLRYPLYGETWSREVVAVDSTPTFASWYDTLRRSEVDVLVVPTGTRQPWEDRTRVLGWIEENPEEFELLFASETARHDLAVYRVRR